MSEPQPDPLEILRILDALSDCLERGQRESADIEAQVAARPTIHLVGERQVQVGSGEPLLISDAEDDVVRAFLKHPVMDEANLIKESGRNDAPKVLRRLVKKYDGAFKAAIRLAGKKCGGGHYAKVQESCPASG